MTSEEGDALAASALDRLDALGALLDQVSQRLSEVATSASETRALTIRVAGSSRRTRHLAIGLAVSLMLDVALTAMVTWLSLSALSQSSTLHTSQLAACAIGNDSRAEQQQLWSYVFQLSGGAKTATQKQFLVYVDKTFAPVNCAQVYK